MRLNFSVQSLSFPEAGELSTVITVGVQVIWLQTDGTFCSVFYISARYLAYTVCWLGVHRKSSNVNTLVAFIIKWVCKVLQIMGLFF